MKRLSSTILVLLLGTPVFACYGTGCSTALGDIYNAPGKAFNQIVPVEVTNPLFILDNPKEYLNLSQFKRPRKTYTPIFNNYSNNQNSIRAVNVTP